MNKKSIISKFLGIFLLLAVFTMHFSAYAHVSKVKHIEKNKAKTEVSALNQEVVVPSVHFEFNVIDIKWPENFVFGFSEQKPLSTYVHLHFQNSYFEKLFEHHIAINAP